MLVFEFRIYSVINTDLYVGVCVCVHEGVLVCVCVCVYAFMRMPSEMNWQRTKYSRRKLMIII